MPSLRLFLEKFIFYLYQATKELAGPTVALAKVGGESEIRTHDSGSPE
jgi:hypothetical protein